MTCKLCLQQKQLCNSHIIPEFFYKPLYDHLHRFVALAEDPTQKNRFHQKGIQEKLLCADCEALLCEYERYAKEVLYDGLYATHTDQPEAFLFQNLDYDKFKLFQLSILWRASVSSLSNFSGISLGPHTDVIRKMIAEQRPGEPYQYGCAMFFTRTNLEIEQTTMLMPQSVRLAGHRSVLFMFGGVFWHYIVSSHSHLFPHRHYFLAKDGTLPVLKDVQGVAAQILQDAIDNIRRTEDQRQGIRQSQSKS